MVAQAEALNSALNEADKPESLTLLFNRLFHGRRSVVAPTWFERRREIATLPESRIKSIMNIVVQIAFFEVRFEVPRLDKCRA